LASSRRDRDVADVGSLVERARSGEARAVARLISLVENDAGELRDVAAALSPFGGHAQVVGLTGSPGVGKSTTTSAMVGLLREAGKRVGVLAVDPSSPFSGGALLGDRVRMQDHATDNGVFIRSMASRGQLGGLSAAVPQALRVLDAAACDIVLVETVGVGQAEVEIASLADTTLLVVAPGFGDGIQAAKAGIIEIADVFVVNKADRDGADQVARDLRYMQSLGGRHSEPGSWRPPIVKAVASRGEGEDKVIEAIEKHRAWMDEHDELSRRRRMRAAAEIEAIALGTVKLRFGQVHGSAALDAAAARVVEGDTDPYTAAAELIAEL
jgi:LAO/AO transport system ATPase